MSALVAVIGLFLAIVLQVNHTEQIPLFMAINAVTVFNPQLWAGLTFLGDTTVVLCVIAFVLLMRPSIWVGVLAAIPVGGITSLTLKWFFDAPRPADVLALTDFYVVGSVLRGHSFPSGHTITAFAIVGVVSASFWIAHKKNSAQLVTLVDQDNNINLHWWLLIALAIVFVLAVLVGISRLAVGAHWPVDVLAGACVGWSDLMVPILHTVGKVLGKTPGAFGYYTFCAAHLVWICSTEPSKSLSVFICCGLALYPLGVLWC